MRDIDTTDRELLSLLMEDARRPYSELADEVGLSGPAVSDRIDRLVKLGIINRFTIDIDRTRLQGGIPLIGTFSVTPGHTTELKETLQENEYIEHIFQTADSRIIMKGTFPDANIETHLQAAFEAHTITTVDIVPVIGSVWEPNLAESTLGLECAECGNTVTSEGVTGVINESRYEFCCSSCLARFEARHDELEQGI